MDEFQPIYPTTDIMGSNLKVNKQYLYFAFRCRSCQFVLAWS